MNAEGAWGERWVNCAHPLSHQYMTAAFQKRSLVVLAADLPTIDGLLDLISQVGDYVSVLKTHVDLIEGFNAEDWSKVVDAAKSHGMMVFEDRKFADIGKVAKSQMKGIFGINSWADVVTSHSVSGPDVVDGIAAAWEDVERIGGVLLLAQMSSRENLISADYTAATLEIGSGSPHVIGYIGNGSSSNEVSTLRSLVGEGKMIWTPGVSLTSSEGSLGQRYGSPRDAVIAGSDAIIVGSGIHQADSPSEAAEAYAESSWEALMER